MLSHVEMTLPVGSLSKDFCADLDQLLVEILGWHGATREFDHPLDGSRRVERTYRLATNQAVVLVEGAEPLRSGPEDHVGISVDAVDIDRLLSACRELAARDSRVAFRYVDDGGASTVDIGDRMFRTFFVRYLLPVWIQIESFERKPGQASSSGSSDDRP